MESKRSWSSQGTKHARNSEFANKQHTDRCPGPGTRFKQIPQEAFVGVGQRCRYKEKPFSRAYAALIQINNDSTQACSTTKKITLCIVALMKVNKTYRKFSPDGIKTTSLKFLTHLMMRTACPHSHGLMLTLP